MHKRIELSDVEDAILHRQGRQQIEYEQTVHLSGIAVCGYRERYYQEVGKPFVRYSLKMHNGVAFEEHLYRTLCKIDNSYVHNPHMSCNIDSRQFTYTPDFYSRANHHIIEVKTTMSKDSYTDVYLRQLSAYVIATRWTIPDPYTTGSLWVFHLDDNTVEEHVVNVILPEKFDFDLMVKAFDEYKYLPGLENSLCKFCPVKDCSGKQVKK